MYIAKRYSVVQQAKINQRKDLIESMKYGVVTVVIVYITAVLFYYAFS